MQLASHGTRRLAHLFSFVSGLVAPRDAIAVILSKIELTAASFLHLGVDSRTPMRFRRNAAPTDGEAIHRGRLSLLGDGEATGLVEGVLESIMARRFSVNTDGLR
jgi:hypothetical protein